MKRLGLVLLSLAGSAGAWNFTPAKLEGKLVGGSYDPGGKAPSVAYPFFLASPGESIDFTYYDYQRTGSNDRTIALDGIGSGGLHVIYMKSYNVTHTPRDAAYQFNDRAGGGWSGQLNANTARSGYTTLAVLADGRAVGAFHQSAGAGIRSVVAVDAARGAGAFTVTNVDTVTYPPGANSPIWPKVEIGPTNVIHVLAHHQDIDEISRSRSTNGGASFSPWARASGDTLVGSWGYTIAVSRTSGRVAMAYTQTIDGNPNIQLNNNVYYIESTDHGATWSLPVNVTRYQPGDTVRAYTDVSGVYDPSDSLHLVWAGMRWTGPTQMWNASAIWHWSKATGIDLVSGMVPPWAKWPGTFWWDQDSAMGNWRRGADMPSLSVDAQGRLYCVWTGQIIPNDISAGGYPNGDLYGRGSVDGGNTWGAFGRTDTMIYITNSHTPGAPPGACDDDDYHSITKLTTDSVRILFIEDKDAGGSVQSEGTTVPCPVKYLAVKADWFSPVGVETPAGRSGGLTVGPLKAKPNPFVSFATVPGREEERFDLYDISGRKIGTYKGDRIGQDVGPGVYFLRNKNRAKAYFRVVKIR